MTKIFTLIYILCSVYSTSPDMNSPSISQNIISGIQSKSLNIMLALNKPELLESPQKKAINYIDELKKIGFLKNDSNNKDISLRNAIIRFQSNCNMDVTGKWDELCMDALEERLEEDAFNYPDIIKTPPCDGKWFTINKSKRILTFYKNNIVLKKYPVAVGKSSTSTPSGKFNIVSKVINPTWGGGGYAKPVEGGSSKNPLGYRWMGLSYKSGSDLGIHGNNSPNSIGKYISHGCIRMINSDVEELFEQAPIKANVWIGTDAELQKWGITQPSYVNKEK